jgi:eukaryotic-like serine/threonine-protein kinase
MTPERHRRLEELCHVAIERDPAERAAFLADACAEDEALRREVEELLAHAEDAAHFIETPALDIAAALFARAPAPVGRQVGPYTLLSSLGSGGMGEVYRARDTLLHRDVAIKILPAFIGSDADRRARFEREAHLLAALNHPHIAAIYALEHIDGMPALVLELVEGDTLADRVARGPLPLDDAITFGRQITDALEAAHEKGIVHRDLKPANIKVTPDGTVKVLDFGLAKALTDKSGTMTPASADPTLTAAEAPIVLGTAAYMSPEQAQGIAVDKRTDIWAFGCVLYEMLTGTRAFAGRTLSETMASVVAKEPDWLALPAHTPPPVRRLLHRCLTKDRKHRLADIADARLELAEAPMPAPPAPTGRGGAWLPWSLAGLFLIAALVMLVVDLRQTAAPVETLRFQVPLPEAAGPDSPIFLSPDGRSLACIVRAPGATSGRLWIHSLATGRWHEVSPPLSPTGFSVFWSPDSRFIGFHADGKLRKIDVTSGGIQSITDVAQAGSGTWTPDNLIVFVTPDGLKRVPASGGSAVPVTLVNPSRGEIFHVAPRFLPDGRHFIYLRVSGVADLMGLYVGSVDVKPEDQDLTRVVATRSNGEYVASGADPALGDLLYGREGTLITQRFDAARRQVIGDPIPVAEQVAEAEGPTRIAYFSVSNTGVLAYRPRPVVIGTPVWIDRNGRELGAVVDAALERLINVRLSPDGKRLALIASGDLWVYDLTGRPPIRLTSDGGNDIPLWTPDGLRLIYSSGAPAMGLLSVAAVQGATPERISPQGHYHAHGWSPQGDLVAVRNSYSPTWWDILKLPARKGSPPEPHLQTAGNEGTRGAALSPDGRWLAYTFDGTGKDEVYVGAYPDLSEPRRISSRGGSDPVWAKSGRELYYLEGRNMMAVPVPVQTTPVFRVGPATKLFESHAGGVFPNVSYDVAADGRFLMIKGGTPSLVVQVVLNWRAGVTN